MKETKSTNGLLLADGMGPRAQGGQGEKLEIAEVPLQVRDTFDLEFKLG